MSFTDEHLSLPESSTLQDITDNLYFFVSLSCNATQECTIEDVILFLKPISKWSGYISLIAWILATLPRVIMNYSGHSIDGLSTGFLVILFCGDVSNFFGCILTDSMLFQGLISGYLCAIDIILAWQLCFYHNHESRFDASYGSTTSLTPTSNTTDGARSYGSVTGGLINNSTNRLTITSCLIGTSEVDGLPLDNLMVTHNKKESTTILNEVILWFSTMNSLNLGKSLGWTSACLYLSSNIYRIIMNSNSRFKTNRFTTKQSIAAALVGNVFYAISLLTCRDALTGGPSTEEFWDTELCYFTGAIGAVPLYLCMLFQWYYLEAKENMMTMTSHMVSQEGQHPIHIPDTLPSPQLESLAAASSDNRNDLSAGSLVSVADMPLLQEQSAQHINTPQQGSLKEPGIHHQQRTIQQVNSNSGQSRPQRMTNNTQKAILDQIEMIPPELMKYWNSRFILFKRFDDGIQLTHELWYSVTPEILAAKLATFIKRSYPTAHNIVDLFCGGGGNTIQFMKVFGRVIGIDINKVHLECTRKNALVYLSERKVSKKLTLLCSCWGKKSNKKLTDLKIKVDIMFGSPPWGGIGYSNSEVFDVNLLKPYPLDQLLMSMKCFSNVIVLFLPRNSSIQQIKEVTAKVFGKKKKVTILEARIGHSLKGLFCCWGRKFKKDDW
ncbi:unnamed protein product [Ambrosiozyma monospora]|uniref:Trimethylguanosine synthase n=1 Tax=Ambrosiozyma monospora TaxID=43982 RepID=A0A9W6YRG1_AMBMO|nr:unnamed protein product [Ambrosiozyma monospora]